MWKIAILASGGGSNALNICSYFQGHSQIQVALIASNKKQALVLEKAQKKGLPNYFFSKSELEDGSLSKLLLSQGISHVVLAGFLLKVPDNFLQAFPDKIINIHPSLLPKFGGKGMYGKHVHSAVKDANEKESGISIHLVNQEFDKGKLLFQASCKLSESDNAESIENKVRELELAHFPKVIEAFILDNHEV